MRGSRIKTCILSESMMRLRMEDIAVIADLQREAGILLDHKHTTGGVCHFSTT
jgi:hypothetical protein